jgi:FimV-like protein
MDDNESAQVILQQIVKKGDSEQQVEAQTLLDNLSL